MANVLYKRPLSGDSKGGNEEIKQVGDVDSDIEKAPVAEVESKEALDDDPKPRVPLAKYTGQKVSGEVFFKLLTRIPRGSEDWSHLMIYVYRIEPKIIRQNSNLANPVNIGKYSWPISANTIIEDHGAGVYEIKLNDLNRADKKTLVCRTLFEPRVSYDSNPPKLIIEELDTGASRNRSYVDWCIRRGILNKEGLLVAQTPTTPVSGNQDMLAMFERMHNNAIRLVQASNENRKPDAESNAINKVMDVMSAGSTRALEMVTAQAKQNDPTSLLTVLLPLLKEAKPTGESAHEKMVREELADLRKQNHELVLKMLERKEDGGVEQLLKFKQVFDELGEGAGQDRRKWWERTIETAAPMLLNVLSNITGIIYASKGGNAPQGTGVPAMANLGQAEQDHQPPGIAPPPTPEDQAKQVVRLLQEYGHMIRGAVFRGTSGDAFAESVENMFGVESGIYLQIASLGKEGIISALKLSPDLWASFQPILPKLEKFVDEFLSYGQDDSGKEEETE